MNEPIAYSIFLLNFAFGFEINGLAILKTPDPHTSLYVCTL